MNSLLRDEVVQCQREDGVRLELALIGVEQSVCPVEFELEYLIVLSDEDKAMDGWLVLVPAPAVGLVGPVSVSALVHEEK